MKRRWLFGLLLIGLEVLLFQATYRMASSNPPNDPPNNAAANRPAGESADRPGGATTAALAIFQPDDSSEGETGNLQRTSANPAPNAAATVRYQTYALPQATAHVLTLPAGSQAIVQVSSAAGVDSLENFVRSTGAIVAINGGFFDPQNRLSTSYVVQQGQLTADPRQNDRLMQNPDLTAYLDEILNRSEFRRYQCSGTDGNAVRYAITPHNEPAPPGCQRVDSLGAGPQLLPTLTLEQEGFLALQNGTVVRDALGYRQPNARSAIGLTAGGDVVLVMVAKQPQHPSASGISLPALAEFMKTLGITQALNLDGGGSSSLYYEGKTIFGSVDAEGSPVGRSVKSVLLIVPGE